MINTSKVFRIVKWKSIETPYRCLHSKKVVICPYSRREKGGQKESNFAHRQVDEKSIFSHSVTICRKNYSVFGLLRKQQRMDRIAVPYLDKITEIQDNYDKNFTTEIFFEGVAKSFMNVTRYIHENHDAALEQLLSPPAFKYVKWMSEESAETDSYIDEVIYPVQEQDIYSLMVNNIDITDEDPTHRNSRETMVDITVVITYGKHRRVNIFNIPDSYSYSFAVFKFQRKFVDNKAISDWVVDSLQYYPPR